MIATTRRMPRRIIASVIALTLLAGVPAAAPASAAPALAPSAGEAILFHLQLAEGIENGRPVGQSDSFPVGTKVIFGLLGWQYVPAGTELRVRLFQGDRFVYEDAHIVEDPQGPQDATGAGFVLESSCLPRVVRRPRRRVVVTEQVATGHPLHTAIRHRYGKQKAGSALEHIGSGIEVGTHRLGRRIGLSHD